MFNKKISEGNIYLIAIVIYIFLNLYIGHQLLFSEGIVGRYIDFNVPSVGWQIKNTVIFNIYTWFDNYNNGQRGGFSSTILMQQLILNVPLIFSNSSWFISRWQLLIPGLISVLSFLYLFRVINISQSYKTLPVIFAFAFTYNNYTFSELSYGSMNILLSYGFMPLVLASYIDYLNSGNYKKYLLSIIALCVAGGILQHLVLLIIIIMLITVYTKKYRDFLLYVIIYIGFSLYWILPLLVSAVDIQAVELKSVFKIDSYNLADIFSHRKYLAIGGRIAYETLIEELWLKKLYWSNAVIFTFLPFILILFNKSLESKNINIIYFLIFQIILLFLMKGTAEPFGFINTWLYENIPGMILFRTVNRFYAGYMIISAIIICYLLEFCSLRKLHLYLISINLLLLMLPLFFTSTYGMVEFTKNKEIGGINLYVKNDYDEVFYNILNSNNGGKILTNPPTYSGRFTIGNYLNRESQGGDPSLIYGNKIFYVSDGPTGKLKDLINHLERDMYSNDNFLIDNYDVLSLMGIEYFVVRKNIKPEHSINAINYNNKINYKLNKLITLEYSDQVNKVYKIHNYKDLVYIPISRENYDKLFSISKKFFNNDENGIKLRNDGWDYSSLKYLKLNPTMYAVSIVEASGVIPLFLNVNNNTAWNINLGHGLLYEKIFGINKFSGPLNTNGWAINVVEFCKNSNACILNKNGSYNIEFKIIFKSQIYFYIGAVLSFLFLVTYLLVLLLKPIRSFSK